MKLGIIVFTLLVAVISYVIVIYNNLVKNRQLVSEGWSGIDVQLKRRANPIPNMLETVKGYIAHESDTLQAVTEARIAIQEASNAGPAQRESLEGVLSGALGKLMAVAESYPDLIANTTFLEFQDVLRTAEDEIQMSRRYYNGSARNMNIAVESFPSNLVANKFGFVQMEYFELENEADRKIPDVKFN
jgi:LemA protein